MSQKTAIEWCHATWSPWWGCTQISPGCDNCYAKTLAHRFGTEWGPTAARREFAGSHWLEPLRWSRKAGVNGERWRVFPSMCDPFDNDVAQERRERFWNLIERTPNLDWLLLTKRVGNVWKMVPVGWLDAGGWPSNVWLGATVVNQEEADRDIPKLLALPARVRFLSIEPMLGPVVIPEVIDQGENGIWFDPLRPGRAGIGWVIAGGESGPKARPAHPDWFRSLRDQCAAAGVPFLFKQWGAWAEAESRGASPSARPGNLCRVQTPGLPDHYVAIDTDGALATTLVKVGKRDAGRLLDGVQHDGFPPP